MNVTNDVVAPAKVDPMAEIRALMARMDNAEKETEKLEVKVKELEVV